MNTPKIHFWLCILILLAFLPACSGVAANQPKARLRIKPCTVRSAQAQCGSLRVYENRVAHSGHMIDLNIVVIKALSQTPAPDPIFYLAGGPGDAATEDANRQQFPFSLSQNHDLVFVDQRGTGGSNRVLVPTDWVAKVLAGINIDPRFYTTSAVVDDLDDVRVALGYDKINLVGYSYGATAAQYYLRQHGEHVRTMSISSGSLLDVPVFERWAFSSQRALDIVFDRCLADPACQAAFPGLRAKLSGLMARLAVKPEAITYTNPTDGKPASLTLTPVFFAAVIRLMLKDAKNDSMLPLLIHRAYLEHDWQGITNFYVSEGGPDWWGNQIMEHVVRFSEKWAAFDPAVVVQLSQGSFLSGWDISLAQNQALACKYTPAGITPEGLAPQPGSQVPVLTLNGDVDPIDPPDNMAGAKALWPNSVVLVGLYQSHSISDMSEIFCWWFIQNQFIQTRSAEGLDTSCMQSIQPLVFVVP
jgi:pimeloyl-ACP methyl ester carboxylesterase